MRRKAVHGARCEVRGFLKGYEARGVLCQPKLSLTNEALAKLVAKAGGTLCQPKLQRRLAANLNNQMFAPCVPARFS